MKELKHVTYDIMTSVILHLVEPDEIFDAQEFLEELMAKHPRAYVMQMNEYRDSRDPIMVGHSDIISRLNYEPFKEMVEKVGQRRARNVRGSYGYISLWKRLK